MPDPTSQLVITGLGGGSPVGATASQTCAAVRAGINRFKEHPWYTPMTADAEWEEDVPLVCSTVRSLEDALDDPDRFVRLALSALGEVLSGARLKRSSFARGAILLALPPQEVLAGLSCSADRILQRLLARAGLTTIGSAGARMGGQAAVLLALREAAEILRAGTCDFCIVGGVDSHAFDTRLDVIDRAWRLKSLRNVDGFIPGEAAVFVLLEPSDAASRRGAAPVCRLGEVGIATEPNTIDSKKASSGAGLSDAIRAAMKGTAAGSGPDWIVCDLNGESYRAFEWGVVLARLGEPLARSRRLTHPADCLGETGAATGGVLLACAVHGFRRGYAPGPGALIWASSDDGTRAALMATAIPAQAR